MYFVTALFCPVILKEKIYCSKLTNNMFKLNYYMIVVLFCHRILYDPVKAILLVYVEVAEEGMKG